VPVRGRDQAVMVAAGEFRRLAGSRTGAGLTAALQASRVRDVELAPTPGGMPVRRVTS
jgi:phage tail tape-measure protein